MRHMRTMLPRDMATLYAIASRVEPLDRSMTLEHFKSLMSDRAAWTVEADGQIIGCASVSDYVPGCNATAHVFIDQPHHRRWVTRRMLRTFFGFIFGDLDLPRASGFSLVGLGDDTYRWQLALGFQYEGTIRRSARINDAWHDVRLVGMLREECRWL